MSLISTINALPAEAQRAILFRLVGSLNASIIYACQAHIRKTKRDAYHIMANRGYETQENAKAVQEQFTHTIDDFNDEMNAKGYVHKNDGSTDFDKHENELGPDEVPIQDPLDKARQLHPLREYFLDKLLSLSRTDPGISYASALTFMLDRPQREFSEAELAVLPDVTGLDMDDLKRIAKLDRVRSQTELRAMRDAIIGLTDALTGAVEDDDQAEDALSDLPEALRFNLIEKARQGINAARDNVVLLMLRQSGKANLGDLPLFKAAQAELDELDNELQAA